MKSWRVGRSEWKRSAALKNGTAKEAILPSTISHHLRVYGNCSGPDRSLVRTPKTILVDLRLPEQGDLCRIASKSANIVLEPLERKTLIEHPDVEQPEFGHFFAVEETERTHSIVLCGFSTPVLWLVRPSIVPFEIDTEAALTQAQADKTANRVSSGRG